MSDDEYELTMLVDENRVYRLTAESAEEAESLALSALVHRDPTRFGWRLVSVDRVWNRFLVDEVAGLPVRRRVEEGVR